MQVKYPSITNNILKKTTMPVSRIL